MQICFYDSTVVGLLKTQTRARADARACDETSPPRA